MNFVKTAIRVLLLSSAIGTPLALQAQGLFNTGQNVSTVAGAVRDNAWTVTATPFNPSTVAAYVVTGNPGSWQANSVAPQYQWISAATNASVGGSQSYLYTTSFDLTGFSLPSVSFSFQCAKDNFGTTISLNSVSIFTGAVCNDNNIFTFGVTQSINSGFVQGVNSLTFATSGDGGTDGLLVAFSNFQGTRTTSTVTPEPSSILLVGFGASMLGLVARRRRNRAP
ncbi:MAG: PEP-CTERM sorting domain-containing protein [Gemmatimonadaceae bacterium]